MYQIAVIRKYDYISVIHSYHMRIETVFSLNIIPATITYSTNIMDILSRFLRWMLSEKQIYKYARKLLKYFPCFHYLCVFIRALVIWHAKGIFSAPYYIALFDLSGCTVFFHIILEKARCSGKKIIEHKCGFYFL
jgi:hypothetical protein